MPPTMLLLCLSCARAEPGPGDAPMTPPEAPSQAEAGPTSCPAQLSTMPPVPWLEVTDPRLSSGDLVVVFKERRRIAHYHRGALVDGRCWPVGLGAAPDAYVGTKRREGDYKTPEGWYRTSDKPTSRYYHAIAVHYPNTSDAEAGLADGAISRADRDAIVAALARDAKPPQTTPLGGEILIHGGGSGWDWTLGCVAMDDADIDALRAVMPASQRFDVLILP